MQLNLKPLMTGMRSEPKTMPFDCVLDLSHLSHFGERPYAQPVSVKGTARSHNGVITLDYTADYVLHASCGRCLTAVERPDSRSFTHTVVESVADEQSEDLFVLAPGGHLDMAGLCAGDLLLQQESVLLCQDSCKGLCPQCGADRNISDCQCSL